MTIDVIAIDQVEAGRNLDVRVAKKVLRWRDANWYENPYALSDGWGIDELGKRVQLPHFSTDMNDAWQLATAVTGLIYEQWRTALCFRYYRSGWIHAFVRGDDTDEELCKATAMTLPMAICRCTLKIMEALESAGELP